MATIAIEAEETAVRLKSVLLFHEELPRRESRVSEPIGWDVESRLIVGSLMGVKEEYILLTLVGGCVCSTPPRMNIITIIHKAPPRREYLLPILSIPISKNNPVVTTLTEP